MAGGKGVRFTFSVDAGSYSAGANKVIAINKRIAKSAQDAGHATVSQMQASSAAIRALDNPLGNNIRAVERLLTTIPGVGKALQAAFPIVGAVAIGTMIAKATLEVVKFIDTARKVPAALNSSSMQLNLDFGATNDELQVTIDKLDIANGKLEKKPINGMKLAIDEAIVSADKLGASLSSDNDKIADALAKNGLSPIGSALTMSAGTNIANKEFTDFNARILKIRAEGGKAINEASSDELKKVATDKLQNTLKAELSNYLQQVRTNRGILQNLPEAGKTYDAPIASYNLQESAVQNELNGVNLTRQVQAKQTQNDRDQAAKDNADRMTAAARKAAEAQKKSLEDNFTAKELTGNLTPAEVTAYWNTLLQANADGQIKLLGENKEFVLQKMLESSNEYLRGWREQNKKIAAEMKKTSEDLLEHQLELPHIAQELAKAQQEQTAKVGNQSTKDFTLGANAAEIQSANAQAMREANLRVAESSGLLDSHTAAIEEAKLRTDEYTSSLQKLRDEQAQPAARPDVYSDAVQDMLHANSNKQDELTGSYNAAHVNDQAAIAATSISGRWQATLTGMVNSFTDFTGQLTQAFTSSISSLNDTVARVLTARHMTGHEIHQAFGEVARSTAGNLTKSGLQGAEGYVMKSLGIGGGGKLGSSQANALWVRTVDSAASMGRAASGLFGKLLGMFNGGSGSSSTTSAAASGTSWSGINSITSTALSALPMLAGGGPLDGNSPAIIGEKGPELWIPKSSGRVVSNGEMSNYLGGDVHHHHYAVDARGATNPAEVKRQVQMGIAGAHAQLVQSSLKAQHESSQRRPASARR